MRIYIQITGVKVKYTYIIWVIYSVNVAVAHYVNIISVLSNFRVVTSRGYNLFLYLYLSVGRSEKGSYV